MEFITNFFTDFNYLKGLVTTAIILIAIVGLLWVDKWHRDKSEEGYF